ncbi:LIM and SH3 domain protein 1-like isoform X2 [Branchiostoma lanceolatum]|uniref:LIM and SH3 domain protein 1-like isoform X2 n=1 Tax=Branchiostoma lanceolatum TaxID=7740 RepID=UPI003456534B
MNPPCAQCSKTVYPMEKLNCLDKNWHKACFKCEVCNMTLNMKTYKGYNKRPYCSAHYPTTKHTTVADTPESRRLGKQQSLTSGVKYHADFEKQKGNSYSTVTDDPETMRARRNDPQLSDLSYQGAGPSESRRQTTPGEHPMLPPETRRQMIPGEHPMPPPAPHGGPEPVSGPNKSTSGMRAIYDYTAADDDEVSFVEGDVIVNYEVTDEGWMTGTVCRVCSGAAYRSKRDAADKLPGTHVTRRRLQHPTQTQASFGKSKLNFIL